MSEETCNEINGGNVFSDPTDERLYWRIFEKVKQAIEASNPLIGDGLEKLAHLLTSQVPREELYRTVRDRLAKIQSDRERQQFTKDYLTATAGL